MRRLFLFLILLGMVLPISAGEPSLKLIVAEGEPVAKILGPEKAKAGFPVLLQTEGSVGKAMKWIAFPTDPNVVFLSVVTEEGQRVGLFVSPKPGEYYFALVAVSGEKIAVAKHTLVIEGDPSPLPNPPPVPPNPKPEPKPDPKPINQMWAVIVEESGNRSPAQGKVITSKAVADWLQSQKYPKPWVIDKDVANENGVQSEVMKSYLGRADLKKLPFLFLVAETGAVLYEGPLPETEATMLDLMKKHGGK